MTCRALTRLDIEYWELKEVPGYRAWLEAILEVAQSKVGVMGEGGGGERGEGERRDGDHMRGRTAWCSAV